MAQIGTSTALFKAIMDAVREEAQNIPVFRDGGNGAIAIQTVPYTTEARLWEQGIRPDEDLSLVTDQITTKLWPILHERGTIIEDKDGPINCAAFAVMKIAHGQAALAQDSHILHSGGGFAGCERLKSENGFAPYHGAVCLRIAEKEFSPCIGMSYRTRESWASYLDIWVAVSGASQEEDELCATAGLNAVMSWFDDLCAEDFRVMGWFDGLDRRDFRIVDRFIG